MRATRILIAVVAVWGLTVAGAEAQVTRKKAIWGPVEVNGVSQFPTYRDIGAGIFQTSISWADVAPTRPAQLSDPSDPAYRWPVEIDRAVAEGRRYGIAVSIMLTGSPRWANGGRSSIWAPHPADFARFVSAATKRYPRVRMWMIWREPSKASRFQPLVPALGRHLSARQRRGPRLYARLLDASYVALKRLNRHNLVVGGNSWTGGEVTPFNFIRAMRLPNGRRPRMDLYGHNPFTARSPDLRGRPLRYGFADFSDLDTLVRWLDRYGYRTPAGRRLRLYLAELVIPTDHRNQELNFWVARSTQARWLARALRVTRRWDRLYTLGYLGLYDDPPRADGLEVNRGLLDWTGVRKPAYYAFRRG
jgi:hypothetical protein